MVAQVKDDTEESPLWRRTLWAMVGIQLIMTLSFSMLSPIMPLYLPELGVQSAASVNFWSGALSASTPFIAALVSPMWGRVADRHGRKLSLLRSALAISIFTALMGVAADIWQLFALRTLMGIFAGFTASAIALVASQVPEARLGYALGWLSNGQLVGSLVGPIVGGVLSDLTGSYRIPFYCTGAMIMVSLVLVWIFVPEKFERPKHGPGRHSMGGNLLMLARFPGLLPLFFVLLMAQFGVRTVEPVVSLFVQDLIGAVPHLATFSGFAFSVTGLANLIASPFLGNRSDVIGYRRVLLICLLGATLLSAPQFFVGSYWLFVAERFGLGLFIGGILPTANALVGRLVAKSERGTVYGVTASAMFLGSSLGPLCGGGVAALFGLRWVFLVTAALLLANLVWVYYTVPEYSDRRDDDGDPRPA